MKVVRVNFRHIPRPSKVARSTRRLFRDNVQLGTLLAFVAGHVNSMAFIHFGTYVSHVSGHATRAAIHYAEGDMKSAFLFLIEFIAFIFGAGITAFLLKGQTAASSQVKYTVPIFIEFALILTYMVSAVLFETHRYHSSYFSHLTFILAIAMGMQNAMFRFASGAIVRTTHITGVATDFGAELGGALRMGLTAFLTDRSDLLPRITAASGVFIHRLGVGRFLFHGFLLISFSSGAVIGTLGFLLYRDYALVVPLVLLLIVGLEESMHRPTDGVQTNPAADRRQPRERRLPTEQITP